MINDDNMGDNAAANATMAQMQAALIALQAQVDAHPTLSPQLAPAGGAGPSQAPHVCAPQAPVAAPAPSVSANLANEPSVPLMFCGHTKNVTGAMTAVDFLGQLKHRKRRYEWTDTRAVSYAVTSLHREAGMWYHGALRDDMGEAAFDAMENNFSMFVEQFCDHYNLKDQQSAFYTEDLQPQRPKETAVVYMTRIRGAFAAGSRQAALMQIDLEELPANLTFSAPQREFMLRQCAISRVNAHKNVTLTMGRQLMCEGLHDKKLRQLATDNICRSMKEIVRIVTKRESDNAGPEGGAAAESHRIATRNVFAVGEHASSDGEEEVDAIAKKKKKKQGNKKNNKGQASAASDGPPKMCDYCSKPGHTKPECFKKKRDEKKGDDKKGAAWKNSGNAGGSS